MLHAIKGRKKGRRQWCGPSALCLVTGIEYDAAILLLKEITDRNLIKGTSTMTMRAAFERLGWRMETKPPHNPLPTLAAWLRERSGELRSATVLVEVTNHWMVVEGRKGGDSATDGPVWLSDLPNRRARVRGIHVLHRTDDRAPDVERDVTARNQQMVAARETLTRSGAILRKEAMAETERLGCSIIYDRSREHITLDAPPGMVFYTGDMSHYFHEDGSGAGWRDVLNELRTKPPNVLFQPDPDAE
jgi:hypothetical protein